MNKRATILCLAIWLGSGTWLQASAKESGQHIHLQNQKLSASQARVFSVKQQPSTTAPTDAAPERSGYQWHELWSPSNIPNWALVVVGIWAACVAIGSLDDLKAQTKAAQDSARAAYLNAEALIRSERPWIVVRRKLVDDRDKCRIIGINRGRTPAEVCEISVLIEIQNAESQKPSRDLEPLPLPRSALTTSGHHFPIRDISFNWSKQKIKETTPAGGILLVFIQIKYWDMFADRKQTEAKPHVTRMCFTIDPDKGRLHRKTTDWVCHE